MKYQVQESQVLAMEVYKITSQYAIRKFYENHPMIQLCFEAAVQDGFPEDGMNLFLWILGLCGNPKLQYGLEPGSLCSVGHKFFGEPEDGVYTINGLEVRVQAFLHALMSMIEVPDENKETHTNLPLVLLATPQGKICVKAKYALLWSEELAENIASRRGLLPPSEPRRVWKASDSVYDGVEGPYMPSRCGKYLYPEGDIASDVANILSCMNLGVNMDVLDSAMYLTKNIDKSTGLPIRLEWEDDEQYQKRCQNHLDFLTSRQTLGETYSEDKILHVRYVPDTKGRYYSVSGMELNPQGNDSQKSIIEFKEKHNLEEVVPESVIEKQCKGMTKFNPEQYLIIALANALGYDKKTWDVKFQAVSDLFIQYKGDLQAIFNDIQTYKLEADEPAACMAILSALDDQWNQDKPIGIPLHWDATSSGAQINGILRLDVNACWQGNVIILEDHPKNRENFYNFSYKEISKQAEEADMPLPEQINKYKLIKNGAIVPWFYGSKKGPEELFGKSHVGFFNNFMKKTFPGLNDEHSTMVGAWNPDRYQYDWTLPDGFDARSYGSKKVDFKVDFCGYNIIAHCKSVVQKLQSSRMLGANKTHSVDSLLCREVIRAAYPDLEKNAWIARHIHECLKSPEDMKFDSNNKELNRLLELGYEYDFYSLRIIDAIKTVDDIRHIPGKILAELLNQFSRFVYDVIPIHDCFMVNPLASNHVRASYIYNLYKLCRSERFNDYIMYQITGTKVHYKEFYSNRQEFARTILETADYAIG